VYVHGGGWIDGNKTTSSNDWLVEAGFVTASIDYRLTNVAGFPAQIHDVKAAVRWMRANAVHYGVDADRIGVWGSSAGGHLSALCAVTNDDLWFDGEGNEGYSSAVQAAVPICPPTDFLIDWYAVGGMPILDGLEDVVIRLLGGRIVDEPPYARHASPLWHVHTQAAPQLVIQGTLDDLVPVGQVRAYVAALGHYGAPVEYREYANEGHAVDAGIFTENRDPHDLRRHITGFFQKHLMG
jgi:acetyl esterase/lipase